MEHAGAELAKIMSELLSHVPAAEAPLMAWPAVCGAAVAGRARAASFACGVLRVEVPDATWRVQLIELEPRYVRELARVLGRSDVQRVEFFIKGKP